MEGQDDRPADQGAQSVYKSWDYVVWAYDRGGGNVPILVVCFEWHIGQMHAIRSEGVWLNDEEDSTSEWDQYPEYKLLSRGVEPATLASLIEQGKLQRVGTLPKIGPYAEAQDYVTEQ